MQKKVPDILAFAAIGDFINQPVKNYSSGMFARLAFATAINVDPDILIVDEVLAVGDIAFQFKCIEKMKEFAKQGVTIIFVTHSMMSLYRFCSRAIWIDGGKMIMDGTVEDVVPRYEDNIKMMDKNATTEGIMNTENLEVVHIKHFRLEQDGKVVDKIVPYKGMTFNCQYTLKTPLEEEPYFAISIIKDGLSYDMFGVFPSQKRYTLPKQKGTYEINIKFENPNLNIGQYDIYFSILEKNGISQLYFGRALGLEVTGELNSLGLIDIEHIVTVSNIT
jgi:ABC-type multidrug transport system ATPase subunit